MTKKITESDKRFVRRLGISTKNLTDKDISDFYIRIEEVKRKYRR